MNDAAMRPGVCELCDQLLHSDEIKSSGRQDSCTNLVLCSFHQCRTCPGQAGQCASEQSSSSLSAMKSWERLC
eukprot:53834-Rhodomonas_salina.1